MNTFQSGWTPRRRQNWRTTFCNNRGGEREREREGRDREMNRTREKERESSRCLLSPSSWIWPTNVSTSFFFEPSLSARLGPVGLALSDRTTLRIYNHYQCRHHTVWWRHQIYMFICWSSFEIKTPCPILNKNWWTCCAYFSHTCITEHARNGEHVNATGDTLFFWECDLAGNMCLVSIRMQ